MIPAGIFAGGVQAAVDYQTAVVADAPIVYFPLGEAVGSSSAVEQISATPFAVTGTRTFGAAGVGDRATSVDLVSGYVNFGEPSALLAQSNWSAEALVNFDTLDFTDQSIVGHASSVATRWYMYVAGGSNALRVRTISDTSAAGAALSAGVTYHVAFTCDGTTLTVYLNGAVYMTKTVTGGTTSGSSGVPHALGDVAGGGVPVRGRLGGVAVYNKVLSGTRVLAHAHAAGVV